MRSSSRLSTASIAAPISCTRASARERSPSGSKRAWKSETSARRDVGMPEQRLLHVAIAERDPGLAQVARDRAQHRHLTPIQAGGDDQGVEAVELRVAAPDAHEAFVEALADRVDVDVDAGVQAEVVDPRGGGIARRDEVRPLVGDGQTEALEHRQHVGERDPLAAAVELAAQRSGRRLQRPVQAEIERDVAHERLDPLDVGDRRAREQVLAIGGRERRGVAAEERGALLLAVLLREHGL